MINTNEDLSLQERLNNPTRKVLTSINSSSDPFILVVEGPTDVKFYTQFVKSQVSVLTPNQTDSNDIGTSLNINGKKNVYLALKLSLGLGKKNYFGIVDKDYDFDGLEIPEKIKNSEHLFITDANNLETTIIQYDDGQINKAIKKEFSKIKLRNYSFIKFNILDKALSFSYYIGIIRFYDAQKAYKLSLNNMNQYYSDYINVEYDSKTKNYDVSFDYVSYVKALIRLTKNNKNNVNSTKLLALLNNYQDKFPENHWNFCQGHDIVNIIAALFLKHKMDPTSNISIENIPENMKMYLDDIYLYQKKIENIVLQNNSNSFYKSYLYKSMSNAGIAKELK